MTSHTFNLSTRQPSPLILWSLVGVAISAISCASILIRLADAPPLAIAIYRVAIAALVLAPRQCSQPFGRRFVARPHIAGSLLLTGLFLAAHFFFWIESLERTSVASSVCLVSTTPLFTGLFSLIFLREKPWFLLWLGIFATIAGSVMVAALDYNASLNTFQGDLLALLGALMASGYLLMGRWLRRFLDIATYAFYVYTSAALVLLTASVFMHTELIGFSTDTYVLLVALGIVPQLIGHTTFNWTLRFLPATLVAVLTLGEPIGATGLAYLFLDETLSLRKAAGLAIIGIGIVLSSLQPSKYLRE